MGTAGGDVEVGILGRIRATVEGRPVDLGGPRQQVLLAALSMEPGRMVSNDVLIDAIWDGDPPDGAARTFRSYVSRLRRSFDRAGAEGARIVRTDSAGYRLDASVKLDANQFEAEISQAREHLAQGEIVDAVHLTERALDRWEGRAFGHFADRSWAVPAAVKLEELRVSGMELRCRALLDADQTALAVPLLEELAAAEPYRESVARLHALAMYRSGRDVEAIQVLRDFRRRLAEEHGLDPSPLLHDLEVMVLNRDPRLDRPVGGKGLRGFILHEPIASSPLGMVHRAEQPSIGREVAVTVLSSSHADTPDVVRAFEARLQSVAGLDHPNLLPVYDYWREPGGAYIVTRLPAMTLEQSLRADRVSPDDALRIGEQVASAVAAAHERGVVHGALGPDAVVMDGRGDAFVWGFPLTEGPATPAHDVAMLADLVTAAAGSADAPTDGSTVRSAVLPAAVLDVLRRASSPGSETVVTAAGLAAALADARHAHAGNRAVRTDVGPNPYRGLAAFREPDADVFFGRDGLADRLVAQVQRDRVVAVVGPSGCGKSSVVMAGVLPRLRRDGAFVTTMVPGPRPLSGLEIALSRVSTIPLENVADQVAATPDGLSRLVRRILPEPSAHVVLVVDQVEELFTQSDPTERDQLLRAIAHVAGDHDAPVMVVLTLRADFLAVALTHPVAGPLVRDRAVMVGPLDGEDLHDIVVRPAESAGVAVEPALAVALVADASRAPGSLPMVQFALTEVFEAGRAEGLMTADAYSRIGGIEGVLGQRAEEVFAALDPGDQDAAHALFQRLVTPGDGALPTRRRASRAELERVPDRVIEAFGCSRLLRFDHEARSREPTVEVSHEALFHAWPRLRNWIAGGAEDLRLLGHLTAAASDWHAGGREATDLYRGSRLDVAAEFADSGRAQLSELESDFLSAARDQRRWEELAQRRTLHRLRGLTVGLAAGLVVAVVAGGLAWTAGQREAQARRDEQATARSAQVDALAFAASAEVGEDVERASLLAAQAYSMTPDLESQSALLDVLDVEPRILSVRPTPFDTCSERTGHDQTVLFSRVTEEGEVLELRTLDQDVLRRFALEPSTTFTCAGLTPAGEHVFVRHFDRYEILDLDLQPIAIRGDVLDPHVHRSLDFDPIRPEAALFLESGDAAIVSIPQMETLRVLDVALDDPPGFPGQVRTVSYSEDAQLLAIADLDSIYVVDERGDRVAAMQVDVPHRSQRAFPFVAAGSAVFGHIATRALVVAPLSAPDQRTEIELDGLTTPFRRGVAVEPGGQRAAVATEAGVVVIDLVRRVVEGPPIPIDAGIIELFWTDVGRLNGIGPNGVFQMDVDRTLLLGTVIEGSPSGGLGTVAPDGSGVVMDGPGPSTSYIAMETGQSVDLGFNMMAEPLPDGRWVAFNSVEGRSLTGDATGTLSSVDVPRVAGADWDRSDLAANGSRAVVLLIDDDAGADNPNRSLVIVLDATSAAVLEIVEPPPGVTYTAAMPVNDGDVLLADLQYRWTIVDAEWQVVDGPRVLGVGQDVAAVELGTGRYVTADFNGDLHVVDPVADLEVDLAGPASYAVDVAFAGGNRLVSRHVDGSTYLWDITAGRRLGRLWKSEPFAFFGMTVQTSTNDLLQMTTDGVARIPLDPDAWLAVVCARVDRQLSDGEIGAIAPSLEVVTSCPI